MKTGSDSGGKPTIKDLCASHGRIPAHQFGPLALKAVRQKMIDAGLKRRTVNAYVRCIRRIFRWAVAEELVAVETYQALASVDGLRHGRTEARESQPILPVEEAIVDATLPYLPDIVADMVRFQRLTGCRPDEVCSLRPCDVDRTEDVWAYRPAFHKTTYMGRERVICVGPQAQSILLRYLARDSETCCFQPRDSEAKRRAVQHSHRKTPLSCGNRPGTNRRRTPKRSPGKRYSPDSYRRAVHRACDAMFGPDAELAKREGETAKEHNSRLSESQRAQIKKWQSDHRWSPNQLRHSAATEIRRKYGLEAAQVVLGHSQANVTQVYAERDFSLAARVAKEVG